MFNYFFVSSFFLLFKNFNKIMINLFFVELLSFFVLLFFLKMVFFFFFLMILMIVLSGIVLSVMSLHYINVFSKNKIFSYLKFFFSMFKLHLFVKKKN